MTLVVGTMHAPSSAGRRALYGLPPVLCKYSSLGHCCFVDWMVECLYVSLFPSTDLCRIYDVVCCISNSPVCIGSSFACCIRRSHLVVLALGFLGGCSWSRYGWAACHSIGKGRRSRLLGKMKVCAIAKRDKGRVTSKTKHNVSLY